MKKQIRTWAADVVPACLVALLVLSCFAMAEWGVRADSPSGNGAIINCNPGTLKDCSKFLTEPKCFDGQNNNNCYSDPNCNCRWVPGADNVYACYCQNTTGN
jgi:hypothetical protein